MADERLRIIMDALDLATDELSDLQKELEGVETEAKETSTGMFDLGNMLKGPVMAAVGAFTVGAVVQAGTELFNLGLEARQTGLALEAYTGSTIQAEQWTQAIKEAANGAISEMDAMSVATQLAASGLATSSQEAGEFARIASQLGGAIGLEVNESVSELALLIQNLSYERLDSFGHIQRGLRP